VVAAAWGAHRGTLGVQAGVSVPGGVRNEDDIPRGTSGTVFVSDPTAEAERFAQALRAAGYTVVDVPLSMLVARVAVQHPRVILVDSDSDGALDVVARMRELPDADGIDVVFVARPGGVIATNEDALAHEGSGFFERPVDVAALVRKVEVLTGGARPSEPPRRQSEHPPPTVSTGGKRPSVPPSLPPASMRGPQVTAVTAESRPPTTTSTAASPRPARAPSDPPGGTSPPSARRVLGIASPVSPELQQLLTDAEQRANVAADVEVLVPSPEEEIEAVLPAELLASLDEPLDEDEEDDDVAPAPPRSSVAGAGSREGTHDAMSSARTPTGHSGDGGGPRTTGASGTGIGATPATPATGGSGPRHTTGESVITPPPVQTGVGTHSGSTGDGSSTTGGGETHAKSAAAGTALALGVPSVAAPSVPPPETGWVPPAEPSIFIAPSNPPPAPIDSLIPQALVDSAMPAVITPGDAMRSVGRSIAMRTTGSLCFVSADGERRVVIVEGDIVTAASTAEDESLLAFLGVRGELPRETVRRLAPKFPPFGRHAGAALVARGYLRQDTMWTTLRAHAEWVLARIVNLQVGRLLLEPQAPGRLATEPPVFGGASGAAVFVEVLRRIVPTAEAVERLGGTASRIGDGPSAMLLGECALDAATTAHVRGAIGRSVRDVLAAVPEGDLATVLYALSQLGVIEVLRAVGGADAVEGENGAADVAALDAEAVRERVRARLQLVDDGDYFAVLGVARDATGYEVKRAFLELRRAFDPSRILTPEIADLADDVRKIVVVLEEAYEILKEPARRERYRRAIEAVPEG
jgi:hypothetical protein